MSQIYTLSHKYNIKFVGKYHRAGIYHMRFLMTPKDKKFDRNNLINEMGLLGFSIDNLCKINKESYIFTLKDQAIQLDWKYPDDNCPNL